MTQQKKKGMNRWTIKNYTSEKIQESDKLDFLSKSKDFRETIKGPLEGDIYENISKSNLIEGPRGSGKSTFINLLLWQIQNDKEFLKGKKLIPVFFSPWYIIDPQNFFEYFFETLTKTLLQEKYSHKLSKVSKEFLGLIKDIDNNLLSIFINLFSFISGSEAKISINEQINELCDIINKEYKEYFIVIVTDEVDRLSADNLHEVAKVLDIGKQIADYCDSVMMLCGWDNHYMNKLVINNQDPDDKDHITYQEYLGKFYQLNYDVYHNSHDNIVDTIYDTLKEYFYGDQEEGVYKAMIEKQVSFLNTNRMFPVIRYITDIIQKAKKLIKFIPPDCREIDEADLTVQEIIEYNNHNLGSSLFLLLTIERHYHNYISWLYKKSLGYLGTSTDDSIVAAISDNHQKEYGFNIDYRQLTNVESVFLRSHNDWHRHALSPIYNLHTGQYRVFIEHAELNSFYIKVMNYIKNEDDKCISLSIKYVSYIIPNIYKIFEYGKKYRAYSEKGYLQFLNYIAQLLNNKEIHEYITSNDYKVWTRCITNIAKVIMEGIHIIKENSEEYLSHIENIIQVDMNKYNILWKDDFRSTLAYFTTKDNRYKGTSSRFIIERDIPNTIQIGGESYDITIKTKNLTTYILYKMLLALDNLMTNHKNIESGIDINFREVFDDFSLKNVIKKCHELVSIITLNFEENEGFLFDRESALGSNMGDSIKRKILYKELLEESHGLSIPLIYEENMLYSLLKYLYKSRKSNEYDEEDTLLLTDYVTSDKSIEILKRELNELIKKLFMVN